MKLIVGNNYYLMYNDLLDIEYGLHQFTFYSYIEHEYYFSEDDEICFALNEFEIEYLISNNFIIPYNELCRIIYEE